MMRPWLSIMGDAVTDTSIRLPSLVSRTVSKGSIRSPAESRRRICSSSSCRFGRDEPVDRSSYDLIGPVAEQAFRACVPTEDDSVQILGNNRIVRRLDKGRQPCVGLLHPLPLGYVYEGDDDAVDPAVHCPIGEDPHEKTAADLQGGNLPFYRDELFQHRLGVTGEARPVDGPGQVAEGAADVGGEAFTTARLFCVPPCSTKREPSAARFGMLAT